MTWRLKVCRRLLVVMKPKRRNRPVRVSSAAWCHQYMTKSADSGHIRPGPAQGLDIAVPQGLAHALVAR